MRTQGTERLRNLLGGGGSHSIMEPMPGLKPTIRALEEVKLCSEPLGESVLEPWLKTRAFSSIFSFFLLIFFFLSNSEPGRKHREHHEHSPASRPASVIVSTEPYPSRVFSNFTPWVYLKQISGTVFHPYIPQDVSLRDKDSSLKKWPQYHHQTYKHQQ